MASEMAIKERAAHHLGLLVILALAALTAIEFVVFAAFDNTAALIMLLVPIAIAKAWLIVNFFMHVSRAWRNEESH
ncbi:MAG TPA: cytochrome C oxidase subunit IV family protein [Dehalococcoidia bacterium]|jgi:Cu/Ag efflux pump CusA|nr:cytochrome C oxidase subunit IV family protein [Dehalococcoidia bacterium]